MNKAVFLDRDGVINKMIFNKERNEYEPPHKSEDVSFYDDVRESIKKFADAEFKLFIVSNQPDFAKGKTSLENLIGVKERIQEYFSESSIFFKEQYYCFHHPEGNVPDYSIECKCRKPKTYFIDEAVKNYNLNRDLSWMIGDRETDIQCGIKAGLKTILVLSNYYKVSSILKPDFIVGDLNEAAFYILQNNK